MQVLTAAPIAQTTIERTSPATNERCSPPAKAPLRLIVAEDHELVRFAIREALSTAYPGTFVTNDASTLAEALHAYQSGPSADLVLLDLTMPDCRGLQGLQRFLAEHPEARLLIIGGSRSDMIAAQARAMGAVGFAPRQVAAPELVRTIAQLCAVEGSVPLGVPRPSTFPRGARLDLASKLSSRHLQVLDLLLFGFSNQAIAEATSLKLGTVKNYVSEILLALDVRSRAHLLSLFA